MSRVPPELIGLDNVMEEFLAEHRQKNLRIVEADTDGLIKFSEEIWEHYMDEMRRQKQIWADAHIKAHFSESESEADRKFIESANRLIAENRALLKKRFSWAGFFTLLAVAIAVGYLVVLAMEAF